MIRWDVQRFLEGKRSIDTFIDEIERMVIRDLQRDLFSSSMNGTACSAEHSALNIFDEYSMTDPKGLGKYFGFTAEEVTEQCKIHSVYFEKMERWYDGYLIGDCHVCNPKSVADALTWKEFRSYSDRGAEPFGGTSEDLIALSGKKCIMEIR